MGWGFGWERGRASSGRFEICVVGLYGMGWIWDTEVVCLV